MFKERPTLKRSIFVLLGLVMILAVTYYSFFTLENEPLPTSQIVQSYDYMSNKELKLNLTKLNEKMYKFTYTSFDGSQVNGQINYPDVYKDKYPVVVGMHAMGRSYPRWWTDSLKGRPTVTQVNKITDMAIKNGHVVIAIDARYHGSRKVEGKGLRGIMTRLTLLGNKSDYVEMINHTILDYRVLLDWIEQQKNLDIHKTKVVGYSMGGQMSLLLAGVDQRVSSVMAIVPPYLTDTTASVAPKNITSLLETQEVWLVSSDDDENASEEENLILFDSISSKNKKHIVFPGSHILPKGYVERLSGWFQTG